MGSDEEPPLTCRFHLDEPQLFHGECFSIEFSLHHKVLFELWILYNIKILKLIFSHTWQVVCCCHVWDYVKIIFMIYNKLGRTPCKLHLTSPPLTTLGLRPRPSTSPPTNLVCGLDFHTHLPTPSSPTLHLEHCIKRGPQKAFENRNHGNWIIMAAPNTYWKAYPRIYHEY